jgi:hypothetical protein
MAERIGKVKISRKEGYLYFVGRDGYVWQVPMRATRGAKKDGFLYFVDKAGYIARVKRRNA